MKKISRGRLEINIQNCTFSNFLNFESNNNKITTSFQIVIVGIQKKFKTNKGKKIPGHFPVHCSRDSHRDRILPFEQDGFSFNLILNQLQCKI